jgi:hypothetical protein
LVWRWCHDVKLEVLEVFEDGSWRSELGQGQPKHKRVGRGSSTTAWMILGPPAAEVRAPYPQRWEQEGVPDELKTHQRGSGVVLRSKDPGGVCQEVWGTC